ncbi:DUF5723 family protein [Calditrichota bacterium GD2]
MKKILIILALASALFAQGFDGIALGFGDNYSALSRGVNAINYNPANVTLPRGNAFELNVFGINASIYNNSFSFHTYNNFFVTDEPENRWSDSDKKDFLSLIPDDGLKFNSHLVGNALGLAFNNFALAAQPIVMGEINTFEDKSMLEIALFGDTFSRDYERSYDNFVKGSNMGAVKVSLAYGYPFLQIKKYLPDFSYLAVGIGVNYFISMAYAQTEESDLLVKRTQFEDYELVELAATAQLKTAVAEGSNPVGKGRSFNLGFATQFKEKWNFSLSFLNLGGSIEYTENTERAIIKENKIIKIYHSTDLDDETTETSTDTTLTIGAFKVDIPTTMRLGASYEFKNNLIFMAEWVQGFDHALGNSTTPRVGGGVLYKPFWWLPVRGGFSLGGNRGFILAMGSGIDLKYWTFNFSLAMKNALWPTHSEGLFAAVSMMLKL